MTFGISQQVANHPTKKMFLGYGDDAIRRTLQIMAEIINSSAINYYVRRWAEKIIEGIPKGDDLGKVNALFWFLHKHTRYVRDPQGIEFIKTPLVPLQLIEVGEIPYLDCDCLTVLILSLLKSIGFPVALRAISATPDRRFRHVYGMVRVKNEWVPIDLCKDAGPGYEYPNPTRTMDYKVS